MLRRIVVGMAMLAGLAASQSSLADEGTVKVLYAGSLVNVMERAIGPAFEKQTGLRFEGYAAGSKKIANEIKAKLRRGDVFISASPKVNDALMGAAGGNQVTWYATFAKSPLLIGYNAKSRFAQDFRTKRWDEVLETPGIRIGRTDPRLDPKGMFTLELVSRAAALYGKPGLVEKTLGKPDNPEQVLPEETLVGRLQSGQLDAGFFYSTETSDLNIPAIQPASELKIQANYTVTVLADAPNAPGAAKFVDFLMSTQGRDLLKAHGVDLVTPTISGDAQAVPTALKAAFDPSR